MQVETFLKRVRAQSFFRDQILRVQELPGREAQWAELPDGLRPELAAVLRDQGIERLYTHQAEAIAHVRAGRNVVVVTGTASGKTLCYTIPTVETFLADPAATALFLYPTKALAQDQLRGLTRLVSKEKGISFLAGTYDGDTPGNLRRKLRDGASAVLSNPDMLHQGILPQHARWNRFFSNLRYVVIDEVHAYRGVFGSHLANVVRRLRRVCRHYGADPQFICSSATIANPVEHASAIVGAGLECVARDGSPRGGKSFVFWNPPAIETAAGGDAANWRIGGDRRSPVGEAVHLLTALVREGIQSIAFVRTRLAAELIFRDTRERLRHVSRRLADSVHAYRGGYLPEERREIERRLAARELLAVASTNALELGIDIGSLDACLLVGYPGTIASLWQQAGRAGRGADAAVVFLLAQNAPMDQFLMAHTDYLFGRSPEHAVIDADNPHIVVGHLKCAAHELPLADAELADFGAYAAPVADLIEEDGGFRHLDGHWYWASSVFPAATVSLRNIAGPVYTIQDEAGPERVIGTLDEASALAQLHTHAVYLHGADTYFVNRLDTEQKIAFVERKDLDYYTQSVQASTILLEAREEERVVAEGELGFGDVKVATTIPQFKKIRFHSRDSLGFEPLELPTQELETVAMWFLPPEPAARALAEERLIVGEALIGIANVLVEVAPFFVMCDTRDIGTVVDARNLGRDALFLHDRYPGGMGFARRCFESFSDLLRTVAEVIRNCGCEDGCPSCVGSPIAPFAATDLDSGVRGRIPNKAGALRLLDAIGIV